MKIKSICAQWGKNVDKYCVKPALQLAIYLSYPLIHSANSSSSYLYIKIREELWIEYNTCRMFWSVRRNGISLHGDVKTKKHRLPHEEIELTTVAMVLASALVFMLVVKHIGLYHHSWLH